MPTKTKMECPHECCSICIILATLRKITLKLYECPSQRSDLLQELIESDTRVYGMEEYEPFRFSGEWGLGQFLAIWLHI